MKILVINSGSSSLKLELFDKKINSLAQINIEKIGQRKSNFSYIKNNMVVNEELHICNYEDGLKHGINHLLDKDHGVLKNIRDIDIVGHRVVHGGDMDKSCLINQKVFRQIEKNSELAPLHNPVNLEGISTCKKIFKRTKQVAVFDTAFHQTMPEKNYIYPLPYELYEKHGVRKYGFHGISHQYLTSRGAEILKKPRNKINLITCHLGAGCSMTAIKNGKSYDTSMGFTPIEGLMMSTRSGDIDPGINSYLVKSLNISVTEVENILNHKSGLLGVSGVSQDMRDILKKSKSNTRCKLALNMFIYRIQKYIGSYVAVLSRVDVIIFSGGIGARSDVVRGMICKKLESLGIKIDNNKNKKAYEAEKDISDSSSNIKVLVVPTDEEKMIAIEAKKFV